MTIKDSFSGTPRPNHTAQPENKTDYDKYGLLQFVSCNNEFTINHNAAPFVPQIVWMRGTDISDVIRFGAFKRRCNAVHAMNSVCDWIGANMLLLNAPKPTFTPLGNGFEPLVAKIYFAKRIAYTAAGEQGTAYSMVYFDKKTRLFHHLDGNYSYQTDAVVETNLNYFQIVKDANL